MRAIVQFERGEGGDSSGRRVADQLRTTVHSPRLKAVLKSFGSFGREWYEVLRAGNLTLRKVVQG